MGDEFNRYYVKIPTMPGIDAKTIYEELKEALGSDAPSARTVRRWAQRFRERKKDVDDDPRSGRPISVFTNENIERVQHVIEDEPHCTYDDIIAETSLSHGTIERIIHDCLKMRKMTSRWVAHNLMTIKNKKDIEFVIKI